MDYVLPIERLVAITLASWEIQLQIFETLNDRRMRAHSVSVLKQLLHGLLKQVNSIEGSFLCDIMSEAEEKLRGSAVLSKIVQEASRKMPDTPQLADLSEITEAGHQHLVSEFAAEEAKLISQVRERFSKMRERINALSVRLEQTA